jgi:trimeric autotransporter adhesin
MLRRAYAKASNTDDTMPLAPEDNFGCAVALNRDGNTLAVGAFGEGSAATGIHGNQNDNSASSAGAVYLYK